MNEGKNAALMFNNCSMFSHDTSRRTLYYALIMHALLRKKYFFDFLCAVLQGKCHLNVNPSPETDCFFTMLFHSKTRPVSQFKKLYTNLA